MYCVQILFLNNGDSRKVPKVCALKSALSFFGKNQVTIAICLKEFFKDLHIWVLSFGFLSFWALGLLCFWTILSYLTFLGFQASGIPRFFGF